MNKTMELQNIIGKTFFTPNKPGNGNEEYVCVGFAQNDTFLVFGALNDITNNRCTLQSFKLTEVKFKGTIAPS